MNDEYLEHYGVLGMKWGVRKDPQRAYSKSMKKLGSLDKKREKTRAKADKLQYKADKQKSKALRTRSESKSNERMKKAAKTQRAASSFNYKSTKYRQKGEKWAKKMNEYFSDVYLDGISPDDVMLGRRYYLDLVERSRRR